MSKSHSYFPKGYPIEVLEEFRRPTPNEVKRAIASRCAWIIKRIEARARLAEPVDMFLMELAALVEIMEVYEAVQRAQVAT